jgi:hypothetical protein
MNRNPHPFHAQDFTLTIRRSEIRARTNATDYRSIVAGMSETLGTLSREIATEIRSRLQTTPSQTDRESIDLTK